MWYGAAYYPEHWPEKRWARDAELMVAAGFNVVRLAEFAWCRLEPEPDTYTFDWLDRAIATLQDAGLQVLLGTPTAGPPAWLVHAPSLALECRMVYEQGGRWQFGGRSLCCVNHPHFIERSRRIAVAMANRYAAHPAVMGWQLDNELGMYGVRCHCPSCEAGFRDWLARKYVDVATLNKRLGMVFGGGEFRSFADVPFPRRGQDLHNPGLLLDSQRFLSDSNVAYLAMQAAALRAAGVTQPITHNVCHMFGSAGAIDTAALFEPLDVAAWDNYPQQFGTDPAPATLGLLHSIARSYKKRPYWMLEQQSGAPFGMPADDPRRIRLWAWQSLAHGAELILFFRWRTCTFGGEQYWRGILDHDGDENGRYAMVQRLGKELERLTPRLAPARARRVSAAAIWLDHDNIESLGFTASVGAPRLDYRGHAETYYAALAGLGHVPDVVHAPPAPGACALLVVPACRLLGPDEAGQLRAFVEHGGTLVAGIGLAGLNRDHVAPTEPLPWLLDDVFGVRRIEWSALGRVTTPPKERLGEDADAWNHLGGPDTVPVVAEAGPLQGTYSARIWCDHLRPTTAEVLARFAHGSPAANSPAVTLNRFGQGRAVYVAAVMDAALLSRLMAELIDVAVEQPASDRADVEVVTCSGAAGHLCFVLNHGAAPADVRLPRPYDDLISGTTVETILTLAPYDVAVLAP